MVQEEFRNGNQTSSTGYRLNSYFPDFEYYIPQCTAGGLFERIQCTSRNHSVPILSYTIPLIQCWCVDPVTGISVDYSTVYGPKNANECDDTTYVNTTALCEVGIVLYSYLARLLVKWRYKHRLSASYYLHKKFMMYFAYYFLY